MKNTLFKRFISLFLSVLMIASALSLTIGAADHTHTPGEWQSNTTKHWQVCSAEGAVINEADHDHTGEWLEDAENHWKVCSVCNAPIDSAKHTDANRDEYCDYCGISTHKHVPQGDWLKDETNHWRLCKCGEAAVSEAHKENAAGYCSVCGLYVHKHAAQGEWLKDSENHWKLCKCGAVVDSAAHADTDNDEVCNTCGAKVHTHVAVKEWLKDEKNHWQLCSCGVTMNAGAHSDTNSDKICDGCSLNMATPTHTCAAQGAWQMDATNHWLLCSCGETKFYLAAHTYKDGKCIACSYPSTGSSVVNGNWSVNVVPGCNLTHNHAVSTCAYNATANEAKAAISATIKGASVASAVMLNLPTANIKTVAGAITVGGYTFTPGEVIKVFGKDYIVDYISAGTGYVRFISVNTNKTIVYNTLTKSVQTVFEDTLVRKIACKVNVNGTEYDAFYLYGGSHYYLYKNGKPAGVVNSAVGYFNAGYTPAALGVTGNSAIASFTSNCQTYEVYDVFSEIVSMSCGKYPANISVSVKLTGATPVTVIGGFTNASYSFKTATVVGNTATINAKITRATPVAMFAVVKSTIIYNTVRNITPCGDNYDCWFDIVNPGCGGTVIKPGCTAHPGCAIYPSCIVKPGCTIHTGCFGYPSCIVKPGCTVHSGCASYPSCIVKPNKSYVITASANVGGTISPAGNAVIAYGESMTYKFTPKDGFAIAKVIVDGVNVGKVSSYTFKYVTAKHTLQVVFEKVKIPFLDIYTSDWYYDDVVYVWGNDLMQGTSYTQFDPDGDITRGMIVTMLWRLEGEPNSTGKQFSDVRSGSYYADAIRWAARNDIVLGYDDGTFRPNQNITREQLAAILYRYIEYKGEGFVGNWAYRLGYDDVADISDWAIEAVSYLTMKNIIVTDSAEVLDPDVDSSRIEAAVCLHRLAEFLND